MKPSTLTTLPADFNEIIQDQYATQYLESIGAHATVSNIKLVLKNLPLNTCSVIPAWKSRGWVEDMISITTPTTSTLPRIDSHTGLYITTC